MSHISTAKIKINHVIPSVAENAFISIAEQFQYNYRKNQTVSAYDGNTQKVEHNFTGNGLDDYNGVGVNIVNGQMDVVGEFWSRNGERERHVEALKTHLANGYTAEAYRQSLLEMGCSVNISYDREGAIMMEGEAFN